MVHIQFSPSPPFIFAGADKGRGEARQGKEGERRPPAMDPLIKLLDDDVVRDPNPNPSLLILEFVCFLGGKEGRIQMVALSCCGVAQDETMHSGADVEAFTAALNREVEGSGGASTSAAASSSQPLDHGAGEFPCPQLTLGNCFPSSDRIRVILWRTGGCRNQQTVLRGGWTMRYLEWGNNEIKKLLCTWHLGLVFELTFRNFRFSVGRDSDK